MRKYTIPQSMSVEYLLGDHLGSTSITTDNTGAKVSEMRYKPWGEVRYSWTAGQSTTPAYLLPSYTFTSQYSHMDDPSTAGVTEGFGLMFYVSRMYDPALGRFTQADSIVPGGVQGLDRYAYVNNNPVRYTDPTGHEICMDDGNCKKIITPEMVLARFGVKLTNGTADWNQRDKLAALTAVVDVAVRLGASSGMTAINAFRSAFSTYERSLELRKVSSYEFNGETYTAGGMTLNSHTILIARLSQPTKNRSYALAFQNARNNVVHELFHAFARNWPALNIDTVPDNLRDENGWAPSPISAQLLWRQHPCRWDDGVCLSGEVYADMGLGWAYNTFADNITGRERAEFMFESMSTFWSVPGR